jgi:hypothetical protein
MVYFLLEQIDPSDLTDTHTHYKTFPIALSCSSHNLLSRGEHNVPGHFILRSRLTTVWRRHSQTRTTWKILNLNYQLDKTAMGKSSRRLQTAGANPINEMCRCETTGTRLALPWRWHRNNAELRRADVTSGVEACADPFWQPAFAVLTPFIKMSYRPPLLTQCVFPKHQKKINIGQY